MIGSLLRELRKEKKLTQRQLAKLVNLSDSTIRMIELGKRGGSRENILQLANFFNVSIDYLEGRTNVRSNESPVDMLIDEMINNNIITNANQLDIDDNLCELILNKVKSQIQIKLSKK